MPDPADPRAEHDRSTQPGPPPSIFPIRIGNYHIRRLIGAGGMGEVYEAIQEHPRRVVALKVIRPGVASPAALRRFEYESQVLARLHHAGIAQVFEAGIHNDPRSSDPVPFFAMEYIPLATPLTQYADQHALTTPQRIALMARVCDAVAHGHAKGIIHRDLKPFNILVDADGNPKIIDFGVARGTDSDLALTTLLTGPGQLIGTLQYMSPEQCAGDPHAIDHRSDIYALGVILYELLCGKLPYDVASKPISEATRIIRETDAPRPGAVKPETRGELETIILRALHKDRDRRYASVADLKGDLDRFLAGEPILASRDSLFYLARARARAAAGRNRGVMILGAAILAALSAQTIGIPLLFRWTHVDHVFDRLLAPRADFDRFEHVRLIEISDSTDMPSLAASLNLPLVDDEGKKTERALHGKLLETLAPAHPGVVGFDLFFETPTSLDPLFIRGVQSLAVGGVDTVVAHRGWCLTDGIPAVSPTISPMVRWGSANASITEDAAWRLFLADKHQDEEPLLGLAGRILASLWSPGTSPRIELDPAREELRIRSRRGAQAQEFAGPANVLKVSVRAPDKPNPKACLSSTDLVAAYEVEPPHTDAFRQATLDFGQVLRADPSQLQAWCRGKLVLVFDSRGGKDLQPHFSKRKLPGCYAHATGLEQLVRHFAITTPGPVESWALALASASVGVAVGAWLRLLRAALAATLLAAAIVVLCLAINRFGSHLINPSIPLLAMTIGGFLGTLLPAARYNTQMSATTVGGGRSPQ